jgi:arsenate reductase
MKNVLFVCVESSCRSQMAESFFNSMAGGGAESAGISPAEEVDKGAIEVVTMGCIDGCPVTPREKTIEWNIEDPKGKSIEEYRKARDMIKQKVKKLIDGIEND